MCMGAGTLRSCADIVTCQVLPGAVSAAGISTMPCVVAPEVHAFANAVRSTVNISGAVPAAATYLAGAVARLQSTAGGAEVEPSTSSLNDPVTAQACNVAVSGATDPSCALPTGSRSVPPVMLVPAGSAVRFSVR